MNEHIKAKAKRLKAKAKRLLMADLVQRLRPGRSIRDIGRCMDAGGDKPPRSSKWKPGSVYRLLCTCLSCGRSNRSKGYVAGPGCAFCDAPPTDLR